MRYALKCFSNLSALWQLVADSYAPDDIAKNSMDLGANS